MNRRDAGRLGGLQNYLRNGKEHMRVIGAMGGRPAARQQSASEVKSIKQGGRPSRSLVELKRLYRLRIKAGEAG